MVTERLIRETLQRMARQKVVAVGKGWVLAPGVSDVEGEDVACALRTCHLRGWVEIHEDATPQILPQDQNVVDGIAPVYRLTAAGWSAIERSHAWVLATFTIATATLFATVFGTILSLWLRH